MTEDFAALEKREWSDPDVAQNYAKAFARASDMAVPVLVHECGAQTGRKILDLCCGQGNVTAGLLATGAEVTALDFSPAMLHMARKAAPAAQFIEGNAMATGLPDESFDGVTIGFGMPHLPDPPAAMAEAARLTQPGGRFAYSVWSGEEPTSALAIVFGAIAQHGDPSIALPPGPGATDFADPDRAFPALQAAGFVEPRLTRVDSYWQADRADAPYEFFFKGTARGGALLRPQPPDRAKAIRTAVSEAIIAAHGSGPNWTIPIPSVVISATRT
ncbi:class I SAM-dependent methyltransferase [Lutimaribacter marinistellae]|uniref:Class I SAM-dependent methyltransferase n=1 Tax=Lutimaribacter marinistellae TaxID=1820329 RepID=A0ABV7TKL0_9RHOB